MKLKKSIFYSLTIVCLFVALMFSNQNYAIAEDIETTPDLTLEQLTPVKHYNNGENFSFKLRATNNTEEVKKLVLTIGLYDETNNVKQYIYGDYTLNNESSLEMGAMLNIPDEGLFNARAIVWDITSGINLVESFDIPIGTNNFSQYRGDRYNRAYYTTSGPINDENISLYTLEDYKIYTEPAIGSDGTIYFGAYQLDLADYSDVGTSYLIALNPDMSLKWKKEFNVYMFTSPTLSRDENTIYTCLPSPDADEEKGKIVALNSKTGELIWDLTTGDITASPALDTRGNLYVGAGNLYTDAEGNVTKNTCALIKVSPSGKLLWSYGLEDGTSSKPAIDDMGNVYLSNHDGYLYSINTLGKLNWKLDIGLDMSASTLIDPNGNLYVGGFSYTQYTMQKSKMFKVSPIGEILWEKEIGDSALPSSAALDINNNKIYFITSTVSRTTGPDSSYLWALDLDGNEAWKYKIDNMFVQASPCVDEVGNVYVGYALGETGAIGAFDKDGTKLFEYTTKDMVMAPGTLYDGAFYVGDKVGNFYKISR